MESEKITELYLKQQVKKAGGMAYKWVSPQVRGTPDQICLFPNGFVVFVEVKSEKGILQAHQTRFHNHLKTLGYIVYVVKSKKDVNEIINYINKERANVS